MVGASIRVTRRVRVAVWTDASEMSAVETVCEML
jgi:hypothetical protein